MPVEALIVGNLCSLLAMVTDSLSASGKSTRSVLLLQNISQLIYGIGALVLRGYSAVVQNLVSILRNTAALFPACPKAMNWLFIGLGVGLGIAVNNRGLVGWLPIVANLQYSWAVFRFRDNPFALKGAFLVNALLYALFNGAIYNVVGALSNAVVVAATGWHLWKERPGG